MDEVLTGFRVTRSGWYGREGVAGDLMTFGKVMGGGLPAAAFGGRAEIMDRLAPAGPVYQAGTLSGNPLATAAGLATLRACTPEVYARVDEAAAAVAGLAADALTADGRAVPAAGGGQPVLGVPRRRAARSATSPRPAASPSAAYAAFFHAMLDRGVYLPPSPYEAWFLSAAHDDDGDRAGSPARCPPRPGAAAARWLTADRATPASTRTTSCRWKCVRGVRMLGVAARAGGTRGARHGLTQRHQHPEQ